MITLSMIFQFEILKYYSQICINRKLINMQHLHRQMDDIHTKKWTFDKKWDNVEHALHRQNFQRNEDIEYSKSNIESKINAFKQLQTNKTNLINDNIKFQTQDSELVHKNISNTEQQYKNYQDSYQIRNCQFVSDYLQNSQTFADKILNYSKSRVGEVERKLQSVDQNIKKKNTDEMKDLKEASIDHIKNIIQKETESQKKQLDDINLLVDDSIKNMRQTLKQYEKNCQKSELKIQQEIQKLDQEMFKIIDKENKEGDMTYDCLLKLVEDSCSKIQYMK